MDQETPNKPSAMELNLKGFQFHRSGNIEAARFHYDAALMIDPNHYHAMGNLAGVLMSGRLNLAALSLAKKAMALGNGIDHAAHVNYAAVLYELGRYEEAYVKIREVVERMPESAGCWHNLGLISAHLGRHIEAEKAYDRSLALIPTNTNVMSDRALGIMAQGEGQFSRGIKEYEIRWNPGEKYQMPLFKPPIWNTKVKQWKGEDIKGKKLLLMHEQGFGDSLMLIRFIKEVEALGADVAIACPAVLVKLFDQFHVPVFDWMDESLDENSCDYFVPLLSLCGVLDIEPSKIKSDPYLDVPATDDKLGHDGYKVGICWSSGDHGFALLHRRRYIPLPLFFPLFELPDVRLISLQKDQPEKDIMNQGAESFIYNPMPACEDFYDTARVIKKLDLVVAVDSAVAHLASAMGKPVIMLGPYVRCWRWWSRGNGLPWYKNFKIITQRKVGDWSEAMAEAADVVKWRAEKFNRKLS